MYKSQFQKIDPYDWFCGPESHMTPLKHWCWFVRVRVRVTWLWAHRRPTERWRLFLGAPGLLSADGPPLCVRRVRWGPGWAAEINCCFYCLSTRCPERRGRPNRRERVTPSFSLSVAGRPSVWSNCGASGVRVFPCSSLRDGATGLDPLDIAAGFAVAALVRSGWVSAFTTISVCMSGSDGSV